MATYRMNWRFHLGAACCGIALACAQGIAAELAAVMPPAQAQQAILSAVQQIAPQREERRRYRLAVPFGAPLFPSDADLAAPPQTPSPALAAWLALPPAQRRHDLLLTPDVDYYWPAEGRQYSCQFLIHIEALGAGSQLTLVQVGPIEYAGRQFQLLGRTGPGFYVKLLPAAPSARSEAELRAFLTSALTRQQ